jgi:hypothetical protein
LTHRETARRPIEQRKDLLAKVMRRWVGVMSAFHSDYVRAKVGAYAAFGFFYTKQRLLLLPEA